MIDVGQFVVQSGQLSGTLSPWVLKYFVEYFTPFTGLLPLVGSRTRHMLHSFPFRLQAAAW